MIGGMTKRYVHTDAPAAAWMVRHHGFAFNFTNHHGEEIEAHSKNARIFAHPTFVSNQVLKYRSRTFAPVLENYAWRR